MVSTGKDGGLVLALGGMTIFEHSPSAPAVYVGRGDATFKMHRGNFEIEDYVVERVALRHAEQHGDEVRLSSEAGSPPVLGIRIRREGDHACMEFTSLDPSVNRLWLRFTAVKGEKLWGAGEQLSYFNMAGRRFPLWTSEPGVGRDKSTHITWQADCRSHGGGDYYCTNYPQPTYLSSRRYALHVETTAWSAFDFRREDFHEIEVWEIPARIELWARPSYVELVKTLSERFGRQPPLPEWVYRGAIIGLKDAQNSFVRLDKYIDAGTAVSALWCEDWAGVRETSFGTRLFWDWSYSRTRYPELPRRIAELAARGIRYMGYVNPYLCVDGKHFPVAEKAGYFCKRQDSDATYLVDFGEFECGVLDLTNPEAVEWYVERIIGKELLDIGASGWMADFGEYLPTDIRLSNGKSATLAHNEWPVLWAELNARAVARRGKTGEAIFFMRAGYSGTQRHCPLLWAGDQSVDFTRHDGIGTVITAALSSGLLGNAFHHSDVGGYTSLFGNVRTAELLKRWVEMAAFTPVMRTHEGNRPRQNLQVDEDPEVLAHFARMTRIYVRLVPYLRSLSIEGSETGIPVQRPLFLHFEDDPRTYDIQTAYLYGPDLLVAPVIEAGRTDWTTYLPAGTDWVHVWSGKTHAGGRDVTVDAPFGAPPVFYRSGSPHAQLFHSLTDC